MLKRQHIEYELAKLKKNIYNIEQEMFRAFTDMQDDINELNKFIRSTYGLETINYFKEFENLENTSVMEYQTIFDGPVDLSKAVATTIKKGKKK